MDRIHDWIIYQERIKVVYINMLFEIMKDIGLPIIGIENYFIYTIKEDKIYKIKITYSHSKRLNTIKALKMNKGIW